MPSDDQIDSFVRRIREGDAEAFGAVVARYEWPVRSWVAARCPPAGDIDDVAQRTFIEAFKNIGRYQTGTDFKAWLLTIARYQVMAECTRLRRLADYHERYVPHALALELERRVVEPAPQAERRLDVLRGCIASLNESSRELVRLRYERGSSLEEIATQLGRSVGAVKKHFFQIRQKLHDCISARLQEEA